MVDLSAFKKSDLGAFTIMRIPTTGCAQLVAVQTSALCGPLREINLRFDTAEDAEACAKYLADKERVKEADSLKGVGFAVIPWPESAFVTYEVPETRSVKPTIKSAPKAPSEPAARAKKARAA